MKSLTRVELDEIIAELGQPRYRSAQLFNWLYGKGASSYDEMTNLPAALRNELESRWPLHSLDLVAKQTSQIDDTRKYLWRLADGRSVESVGLPSGDRLTVCFSTQVGCAMGCAFCATGLGGFTRNLTPGEIVDQVRLIGEDYGLRVSNAVAMGQGEPFANYDNTLEALRIMNSEDGLGIGARHLTVSTCGLIPGIDRLSREPEQFTLAVSLHSARQKTRDTLMPGVSGMSLTELRKSLVRYGDTTGRRPSLEYALIDGMNDGEDELAALVAFSKGMLAHVNLIPANPVMNSEYDRAARDRTSAFEKGLLESGVEVSVRSERGADIDAACGQLKQRATSE